MSRARRGTGEQLCLMSTWEGGLKVVQWLQVMNVRYERGADIKLAQKLLVLASLITLIQLHASQCC